MADRHLRLARRDEPRSRSQRVGAILRECFHVLTDPTIRLRCRRIMSISLLAGLVSSPFIAIGAWVEIASLLAGSVGMSLMLLIMLARRDTGETAYQLVPLIPAFSVPIAVGLSMLLSATVGHVLGQHLVQLLQALQMFW